MIDIGQNDLAGAFTYLSQASQVIEKIPSFISEIQDAILVSNFSLLFIEVQICPYIIRNCSIFVYITLLVHLLAKRHVFPCY